MPSDPQLVLNRLICDRQTFDLSGSPVEVTGTITSEEASFIRKLIVENELTTCLETGVAYGASTVAIAAALSELERAGKTVRHYGVDPCQIRVYSGAAIAALKDCGLDHVFELCEGPSHLMLPRLVEKGVRIDLAFIDGMHTFDYTVIDLFFADKLLRPGGFICVHDMHLPSKRKALNYLMRYRKYLRQQSVSRSFTKRVGAASKEAARLAPRSAWSALTTAEPLITVKKIEDFEPPWDFFARI
jgi:predicted O-methyltransferase YrrM